MKYAIIADIHANLEALTAVLADARAQNPTHYVCLGDVVGYGGDPKRCVDEVTKREWLTLVGNHDRGALAHQVLRVVRLVVVHGSRKRHQHRADADRGELGDRERSGAADDELGAGPDPKSTLWTVIPCG